MIYWVKVALFIAFLVFCMWLASLHTKSQKDEVKRWAETNGYEVVSSVDLCVFNTGPFWFNQDEDDVYYAKLRDKQEKVRGSYFRFRMFCKIEQAWE
jgi:hypothetical protein